MNYFIRSAIIVSLLGSSLLSSVPAANATAYWDGFSDLGAEVGVSGSGGGLKYNEADRIIERTIRWLLALVGVIAVAAIIYAGLRLVTSRGEEAVMADAKKILFWAVAGLVVTLLGWSIIAIISFTLVGV